MPKGQVVRHSLSGAQSGIWFAQQLDPDNPIFNTGEYIEIQGPVDPNMFELAVRKVVAEAEALHVHFEENEDELWQMIDSSREFYFHFIDVSSEKVRKKQQDRG